MTDLIHPRERTLGTITLVLGLTLWFILIFGTFGFALFGLGFAFVVYVFVHSTLIAYIKGNGVEVTHDQFPDLNDHFTECCEKLKIHPRPRAYILNGNGGLNAFATRFLGTEFVVLLSDVVDAMDDHPEGIRFYIGHELGHLRMKHLTGQLLRWPVLWLPLLGAAYSRARESTCDRHGLACSGSPEHATRALAALSAGGKLWRQLDLTAYVRQAQDTGGFWMSFHELTAGYPWLTKRAARMMDANASLPRRSRLAYVYAAFVPYSGRAGSGFSALVLVYILVALGAVGAPAVVKYLHSSIAASTVSAAQPSLDALSKYYAQHQRGPDTLEAVGLATTLANGEKVSFDPDEMSLTVESKGGPIVFKPALDEEENVYWTCTASGDYLKTEWLPASCRDAGNAR
jgi:Zn-dependent protease with chaperone function